MTHSIVIETQNDRDFALFKELAERLGLRTKEEYANVPKVTDQRELAKNVLALRERFKHIKADPDLDLSSLANEMLGE
jgi:hypothetical protein